MEKKIIIEILSLNNDSFIFMGICKDDNNIHRRIDIKVYNKEEFPFALLYFTGSAYFNRSMRLFARYLGLHLSDKELSYRKNGVKILCKNEREIFEKLGIEYKQPCDRDI
jgi:DNA polymerase lambda